MHTRLNNGPLPSRRRGGRRRIDSILVLNDFSSASRKGLQCAVELAQQFGASLTLLSVIEPQVCIADFGYGPVCRTAADQGQVENARRRLKAMARRIAQGGTITGTAVRSSSADAAVADEARQVEANLVVVGYSVNSDQAQKSATLPQIIARAACPVLIVPEHERASNAEGKSKKK